MIYSHYYGEFLKALLTVFDGFSTFQQMFFSPLPLDIWKTVRLETAQGDAQILEIRELAANSNFPQSKK